MTTSVFLNNDRTMPLLGLGLYKTTDAVEAEDAIAAAVQNGYRLLDTASAYKNEEFVGCGIAKCGVPRKDLFITTKIWNNAQRLGDVEGAFQRSLDRLGLDYIDLYLIHWPVPGYFLNTWKDMEELRRVSGIVPAVNQIECHPLCYPKELIEYCQANDIQVQAYAPLARGAYLDNDVLCVLGTKYAHTPAQIGLRWAVQKGISVIPKSVHPERIASNARIFDFTIDQEDMDLLDTLNQNYHSSSIPEDLRDIVF